MNLWRPVLALVLAAGLLPMLPVHAQEETAPPQKVARVVFRGNQRIPSDEIAKHIDTKPGQDYSPNGVLVDRRRIQAMGFFSDVSEPIIETTPEGVVVTFDLKEYPVIKEIRIIGNKVIPEADIRKVLVSKPGVVMNTQDVQKDLTAIESLYTSRGFMAQAQVNPEEPITPDGVLTIRISEVMVEEVRVVGNKKTKTSVILREIRTKPGEPLDLKKLQRDTERLFNLDIFEDVQPPNLEPGSDLAKAIVTFTVKEKKTGQLSLGLGFSSPQGLVGYTEYSESNFRGLAEAINARLELGGRANKTSYELGFYQPYLGHSNTSLSVQVFNKVIYRFANAVISSPSFTSDSNLFNEVRRGALITFSRPFSDNDTGVLSLRTERWHLNLPEGLTVPIDPALAEAFEPGSIDTAILRGTRDTRDIRTNPANGIYSSIALEAGRASITGAQSGEIHKISVDFRTYLSHGKRVSVTQQKRVLAMRLMLGYEGGVVPFVEQFFVGGADSLRGYLESRFWGTRMMLGSVEYRFPFGSSLQGVGFVDVGDAWGTRYPLVTDIQGRFTQHEGFHPRVGVGAGLRVTTPIGPLRLDYGVGSEGAHVHFSIGHAF
jgi:outer membrane protein insertion porin family